MPPRILPQQANVIKVPENEDEEEWLKKSLQEDDNMDISYFDFGLFWPNLSAYFFILIALFYAYKEAVRVDILPTKSDETTTLIKLYGSYIFNCSTNVDVPVNGLYSILNLFDIDMPGNVIFRIVTTYPMGVRFFNSIVFRMQATQRKMTPYHKFVNDITPMLTVVECVSLALFSIITTHSDSAELNISMKRVFAASSASNMVISTFIMLAHAKEFESPIDILSIMLKMLSSGVYCCLISGIVTDPWRQEQPCHALLPAANAFKEYIAIGAYLIYHGTTIIDVRHMRFMCYPRTCSGECEPIDPINFKQGGKYEHCRSWEYNQHRIANEKRENLLSQTK